MVSTAVKLTSPRKAIASGMAYLPEGRAANALFPMMTVAQNVTLPRLSKFIGLGGLINNPMESAAVSALLKRLDLRPLKGAAKAKIRTFSGGNQQKAIIARWLLGSEDLPRDRAWWIARMVVRYQAAQFHMSQLPADREQRADVPISEVESPEAISPALARAA